jgi:4-carboxymuconolactone decarboxylase
MRSTFSGTSRRTVAGDYLTRNGLDVRTRELLTFSILVALGGADQQVKGHVAANLNVGNDRGILLGVLTVLLPFIGYPRTLNGLSAVNDITAAK